MQSTHTHSSSLSLLQNDVFTKTQTNRCQLPGPLICDPNVPYNNPAVDNPPSDASTLTLDLSSLGSMLTSRVNLSGFVVPTFMAFTLEVTDLAGNMQQARATAIFTPQNYTQANIVAAKTGLVIETASPYMNSVMANGRLTPAAHVWQSAVDTLQVPAAVLCSFEIPCLLIKSAHAIRIFSHWPRSDCCRCPGKASSATRGWPPTSCCQYPSPACHLTRRPITPLPLRTASLSTIDPFDPDRLAWVKTQRSMRVCWPL